MPWTCSGARTPATVCAHSIGRWNAAWGVASRVDYGVAVAGRRGAAASVRPFGEVDLVDDDNRRMRVGMTYQLDSMDKPLRFELSSERVEQPAGTEHRFLLSAEGRF